MASPNIVTLTQDNFQSEVLQSATPVLVDFWAEWCGPCKMMAPALDELATEFAGKAKVAKLNVDEQQSLAVNYRVSSIPMFLVFKGGQVVAQHVGAGGGKPKLKALIDGALA
jgi:thioredoxin 1